MTRIISIALSVLKIPVDIHLSTGRVSSTSHLIVRIQAGGVKGIGEGTPYLTEIYNVYALGEIIAGALKGKDVIEALEILPKMQQRMTSDARFDYGPFLAYETALMDILSKTNYVPFSKLLGGTFRDTIPVCGTISLWDTYKMAKVAEKWVFKKKVNHLKVKVSGVVERDATNLRCIRDAIGYDVLLRIDANQAYKDVKKAAESIKKLEKFEIGIVEQPIKWQDLDGLRNLRKLVAPKIMVDESLRKPSDIDLIAEKEAADIINFHPSKLGCLTVTKRAIEKTLDLGLEYMIGSAPLTGVGVASLLHLAASIEKLCYPNEEVGLYEEFGRDIISNPLKVRDGHLRLPTGCGLGVVLDEKNLSEYEMNLNSLKLPLMDFAYFIYGKSPLSIQEHIKKIYGMLMTRFL
ncbi:hypothetical protein E3J74_08905 [Candidatus Bathyarchaeota archaeon]|nr:MAG: hypothetical protein E3J74_08905 [Candidatus Bathyarchaeota archaeon]